MMICHWKENNDSEDVGVSGKIILQWIFKNWNGRVCTVIVAKDKDGWWVSELSCAVTWGVS
jgi:hypothetical protein